MAGKLCEPARKFKKNLALRACSHSFGLSLGRHGCRIDCKGPARPWQAYKHKMKTTLTKTKRLSTGDLTNGADNAATKEATCVISPPRIEVIHARIIGLSPFVQLKFSQKAKAIMMGRMSEGGASRNKRNRTARDFDDDFKQAIHRSKEGWAGIPAASFRNAMISACRIVQFKMTLAKMSIFIQSDGIDAEDGSPLVKIEGEPRRIDSMVRNATGVADVRIRACWDEWSCNLRVQYDRDQFSRQDVINLLARAGLQVGVGEGRPDSKASAGMGWGQFEIEASE